MKYRVKSLGDMDIYYSKSRDKLVLNLKNRSNLKPYLVKKPQGIYFSCSPHDDSIVALEINNFSRKTVKVLHRLIPIEIDYKLIKKKLKI